MPGGMGVNLVKQYRQAGLAERIPFLSAFTVDESTLPAQQDAAVGLFGGMTWAPNIDNAGEQGASSRPSRRSYGYVPGSYAMQAYDAAMLIDSALEGDRRQDRRQGRARAALRKADFKSLRGDFKFGANGYPDPGLLPGEGGEAAGRQVPDRDRREGLRRTTPTSTRRSARRRAELPSSRAGRVDRGIRRAWRAERCSLESGSPSSLLRRAFAHAELA